jgi:hypothetical protein
MLEAGHPIRKPDRQMTDQTPQEKKRLSYLKDRRNTYGENDKSSRKNIRRNKQIVNRANRRLRRQEIAAAAGLAAPEAQENVEIMATGRRPKRWHKWADDPLGVVLLRKLNRSVEMGIGNPAKTMAKIDRIKSRLKCPPPAPWGTSAIGRSIASSQEAARLAGDPGQQEPDSK